MAFKRKVSGAFGDAVTIKLKVGGVMVAAASVKRRATGAWVETLSLGISLSVSPPDAYGSSATSTVTTDSVTVTASGGTGATKTFTWGFTSNPSGVTALSPSSASTQFRKTSALSGNVYFATARCTVSDGTYSSSITLPVELERYAS